MKKRVLMTAVLVLMSVFMLAGCGNKNDSGSGTTNGAETHGSESGNDDGNGVDKESSSDRGTQGTDSGTAADETGNNGVLEELGEDAKDAMDQMESDVSSGVRDATTKAE